MTNEQFEHVASIIIACVTLCAFARVAYVAIFHDDANNAIQHTMTIDEQRARNDVITRCVAMFIHDDARIIDVQYINERKSIVVIERDDVEYMIDYYV
jgi:hypothetical protein